MGFSEGRGGAAEVAYGVRVLGKVHEIEGVRQFLFSESCRLGVASNARKRQFHDVLLLEGFNRLRLFNAARTR